MFFNIKKFFNIKNNSSIVPTSISMVLVIIGIIIGIIYYIKYKSSNDSTKTVRVSTNSSNAPTNSSNAPTNSSNAPTNSLANVISTNPTTPINITFPLRCDIPLVNVISIISNDTNIASIPISNIVITDQNDNIVVPYVIYNISKGDIYKRDNGSPYPPMKNARYWLCLNPTNIKNITISGNNLSTNTLLLSRGVGISGTDFAGSIRLTNDPVQSYTYLNKQLILENLQ